MCKVTAIRELPDCFDQALAWTVELDGPLTAEVMRRIAAGASLEFYPEFPRPYFRIEKQPATIIQGIVGNSNFRITLSRQVGNSVLADIKHQIEKEY